jgi:thioredoxin reductase (NADPH)
VSHSSDTGLDLLVVGGGPTGIAVGAAARAAGLSYLVVERGALVASLVDYPVDMTFFTTRDKLEIAGVPFSVPDDKPTRRQAIAYYQAVAAKHELALAPREEVRAIAREDGGFVVTSAAEVGSRVETRTRRARAVALATGYFTWPCRLGVPGEERSWVRSRYREPWGHFGDAVVVVGGGNSGAEAALDLWRHGARVTLVHKYPQLKPTIKYWVKPDLENRIEEGSIRALLGARVTRFDDTAVIVEQEGGELAVPADACYVLVGYRPDVSLLAGAGVAFDPETLVPAYDPESCETNVPGLYVAGTVQAGTETHQVFIENSRDHGERIVRHLVTAASGRG